MGLIQPRPTFHSILFYRKKVVGSGVININSANIYLNSSRLYDIRHIATIPPPTHAHIVPLITIYSTNWHIYLSYSRCHPLSFLNYPPIVCGIRICGTHCVRLQDLVQSAERLQTALIGCIRNKSFTVLLWPHIMSDHTVICTRFNIPETSVRLCASFVRASTKQSTCRDIIKRDRSFVQLKQTSLT